MIDFIFKTGDDEWGDWNEIDRVESEVDEASTNVGSYVGDIINTDKTEEGTLDVENKIASEEIFDFRR